VTPSTSFGTGTFLADTSAWERSSGVGAEWQRALVEGQIATCAVVMMEVLYTAQSDLEFDALEEELRFLRDVPITRSVTSAAIVAMRELAHLRPLAHRIPVADALIAAAASDVGMGVLHYDHHYDRLAEVLPFESRWIAPAGSV
jgi:predicted nucleic acid-binding protein